MAIVKHQIITEQPDVKKALSRLEEEIVSWERATSREYALVLVPLKSEDEQVYVSINGIPVPAPYLNADEERAKEEIDIAMQMNILPTLIKEFAFSEEGCIPPVIEQGICPKCKA